MPKTTIATQSRTDARWFVVDASQERLGRMAAEIAFRLQGKHKPTYTPHVDTGDYIVVVNAADVQVSGKKATDKVYRYYTGWHGGLREVPYPRMRERHPDRMVRLAVKRMMPKTNLGRTMLEKLKVYPGPTHEHHAQKPEALAFGTAR